MTRAGMVEYELIQVVNLNNGVRFETYIIPPDKSIFEVKSIGPVPFWFREYGGEKALTRRSFSKFCTAMKVIDPVLRAQIGHT